MSTTRGITSHRVFLVYQDIFDNLEMQIAKLERKRMQWKVDICEGLLKVKLKGLLTMVRQKALEVFCAALELA